MPPPLVLVDVPVQIQEQSLHTRAIVIRNGPPDVSPLLLGDAGLLGHQEAVEVVGVRDRQMVMVKRVFVLFL